MDGIKNFPGLLPSDALACCIICQASLSQLLFYFFAIRNFSFVRKNVRNW